MHGTTYSVNNTTTSGACLGGFRCVHFLDTQPVSCCCACDSFLLLGMLPFPAHVFQPGEVFHNKTSGCKQRFLFSSLYTPTCFAYACVVKSFIQLVGDVLTPKYLPCLRHDYANKLLMIEQSPRTPMNLPLQEYCSGQEPP